MTFHGRELFIAQLPGLSRTRLESELAEIVQERGAMEVADSLRCVPQHRRHGTAVSAKPFECR